MCCDDDSKWRPTNTLLQNISNNDWYSKNSKQDIKDLVDFLETLEEDDDVQNVYSNVNLGGI